MSEQKQPCLPECRCDTCEGEGGHAPTDHNYRAGFHAPGCPNAPGAAEARDYRYGPFGDGVKPAPEPQAEESIDIQALHIAAQCWCDPETRSTVMDPILAQAFAKRLVPLLALRVENAALKSENSKLIGEIECPPEMRGWVGKALEKMRAERDAIAAKLANLESELASAVSRLSKRMMEYPPSIGLSGNESRAKLAEVEKAMATLRDDAIQYLNFSRGVKGNANDLRDAIKKADALLAPKGE